LLKFALGRHNSEAVSCTVVRTMGGHYASFDVVGPADVAFRSNILSRIVPVMDAIKNCYIHNGDFIDV